MSDMGDKSLTSEQILAIRTELLDRREREQAPRREFHVLFTSGKSQQEIQSSPLIAEMQRVDAENVAYLKALIQEHGWPDAERFGEEASSAAFLIVQHSGDIELMSAALPFIEADVKAKRLNGGTYAALYDRLNLSLKRQQRYGSQVAYDAQGEPIAENLEDPEHVDERRRALGMMPLAEYLQRFRRDKG
jgi:hypothetical protein